MIDVTVIMEKQGLQRLLGAVTGHFGRHEDAAQADMPASRIDVPIRERTLGIGNGISQSVPVDMVLIQEAVWFHKYRSLGDKGLL